VGRAGSASKALFRGEESEKGRGKRAILGELVCDEKNWGTMVIIGVTDKFSNRSSDSEKT